MTVLSSVLESTMEGEYKEAIEICDVGWGSLAAYKLYSVCPGIMISKLCSVQRVP